MDQTAFLTIGAVLLPLVGGLIVLILPEIPRLRIREAVCIAVAAITVWFAGRLVMTAGAEAQVIGLAEILRKLRLVDGGQGLLSLSLPGVQGARSIPLGFYVDHLSALTVLAVASIATLVVIYACTGIKQGLRRGEFFAYALWALGAVNLAVLSDGTFMMFMGWSLSSVLLFHLVALGGDRARQGAGKTLVMLGAGDCMLLLACILLVAGGGRPGLLISEMCRSKLPLGGLNLVAFVLILGAVVSKMGVVPLHGWIPRAAGGAPAAVMALMPGGLDKLLAGYLLLRTSFNMFSLDGMVSLRLLMVVLGGATVLFGVLAALVQHDLRRMVAYHTVAQGGFVLMGAGCQSALGMGGAFFQVLAVALFGSLGFMACGAVERSTGTTELGKLGGLGRRMPFTFAVAGAAGLSAAGVPLLAGFTSKWMICGGLLQAAGSSGHSRFGPVFALMAVLGLVVGLVACMLTLAGMLRTARAAFTGPVSAHCEAARPAGGLMLLPMGLLVLATLALGLLPNLLAVRGALVPIVSQSGFLGTMISDSMTSLSPSAAGFWSPMLAGALLLAAMAGGDLLCSLLGVKRMRTVPPFVGVDAAELEGEDLAYPSPEFSDVAAELEGLAALQSDAAEGAFDPYELLGRCGQEAVEAGRKLHGGALTGYLVLFALGLLLVVAALLAPLLLK
jgi:formate hydrogenlyase subunit 3/multisubunit Na+/H+ antiporter MnhD subunit